MTCEACDGTGHLQLGPTADGLQRCACVETFEPCCPMCHGVGYITLREDEPHCWRVVRPVGR